MYFKLHISFTVMSICEDIKLSIIITMNLLIKKSDIIILNEMYSKVYPNNIGYLVYICTKIIKEEKMNILRFVYFTT